MREPIFWCSRCESKLYRGLEKADDGTDCCPECFHGEDVVHEPEQIGERIHLYTKTALACRPHETLPELAASCEELAEFVRQLDAEGFEVVQTSGDGHIYVEKVETDTETESTPPTENQIQNQSNEEEQDRPIEYWF